MKFVVDNSGKKLYDSLYEFHGWICIGASKVV